MKINNVEKKMSNGGPETRKLDMSEFIRLADADKIQSDVENEIIQLLNEKFLEQRKPGETFDSSKNFSLSNCIKNKPTNLMERTENKALITFVRKKTKYEDQ